MPARKHIERKITLARLALGFERVWAALLWPLLITAAFLSLIFSGLLPALTASVRLTAAMILALAFLWSLKLAFRLVWPSRAASHAADRGCVRACPSPGLGP